MPPTNPTVTETIVVRMNVASQTRRSTLSRDHSRLSEAGACRTKGTSAMEMIEPRTAIGSDWKSGPIQRVTRRGMMVDMSPDNWVLAPVVSCINVRGGACVETKQPKNEDTTL